MMDRGSFLVWVGVVLALIAIGLFVYPAVKKVRAPLSPQAAAESLAAEALMIDPGDLDAEFQAIDRELNNL